MRFLNDEFINLALTALNVLTQMGKFERDELFNTFTLLYFFFQEFLRKCLKEMSITTHKGCQESMFTTSNVFQLSVNTGWNIKNLSNQ